MVNILKIPFSFNLPGYDCNKSSDKIVKQLKNYTINESLKKVNYSVDGIKFNDTLDKDYCHDKIQKDVLGFIEKKREKTKNKDTMIFVGGDHSITASTIMAVSSYCKNKEKKKFGLLVFDAHLDAAKPVGSPTNEDWLRWIIENGIVKPEEVFVYGVRNIDKTEIDFSRKKGIRFMVPKERNFNSDLYFIMERIQKYDVIYISIDIDVVDPAYAPAVSFAEPGGITSRQIITAIQKINLLNKEKFFDITEVYTKKDINDVTAKLAAKIISEIK